MDQENTLHYTFEAASPQRLVLVFEQVDRQRPQQSTENPHEYKNEAWDHDGHGAGVEHEPIPVRCIVTTEMREQIVPLIVLLPMAEEAAQRPFD